MKTKLFIDFDGTLFDTNGLKELMFDVYLKAGFNLEDINNSYMAESLDYKFHYQGQLDRLLRIKNADKAMIVEKLKIKFSQIPELVYDDVEEVLRAIDKVKYEIDLMTLGDPDFQGMKVKKTNLDKYFDKKYYPTIQKWEYLKEVVSLDEFFILVDDRGDACEMVKKNYPKSLPIEINRTDAPSDVMEGESHFSGIKIKNLTQLLSYL